MISFKFFKKIGDLCRVHPVAAAVTGIIAVIVVGVAYLLGRRHGKANETKNTTTANNKAATATKEATRAKEKNEVLTKDLEKTLELDKATKQVLDQKNERNIKQQEQIRALQEKVEELTREKLIRQNAANHTTHANTHGSSSSSSSSPSSSSSSNASSSIVAQPVTHFRNRGRGANSDFKPSNEVRTRSPSPQ